MATHLARARPVQTLYQQAGLDLIALAHAPRIAPDNLAPVYWQSHVTLTGKLQVPVLTLHPTGDTQAQVEQERAYADLEHATGSQDMLRLLFVHRADHCTQTGAELLTALQALMQRIETGFWENAGQVQILNRHAQDLGPDLNTSQGHPVSPAFIVYAPGHRVRPLST